MRSRVGQGTVLQHAGAGTASSFVDLRLDERTPADPLRDVLCPASRPKPLPWVWQQRRDWND